MRQGLKPHVSAPKPSLSSSAPGLPAEGPDLTDVVSQWVSCPSVCCPGCREDGGGKLAQGGAADEPDLRQVIGPGPGDGGSAVPVTSFVACLSTVFRNLEGLVTSLACSFHPAARLG